MTRHFEELLEIRHFCWTNLILRLHKIHFQLHFFHAQNRETHNETFHFEMFKMFHEFFFIFQEPFLEDFTKLLI